MSKNKEDRYQSAAGIRSDLELCLHHIKTPSTVWSCFPAHIRSHHNHHHRV
jgi:hypothetical protein